MLTRTPGRVTLLLVRISEADISACALQGADMRRFLALLAAKEFVGRDAESGERHPNPFDEVALGTSWGLLVFTFYAPTGSVTKAMNVELLFLTRELVVSDDGAIVDRYASIVDALLEDARTQLLSGKKSRIVERGPKPAVYSGQNAKGLQA